MNTDLSPQHLQLAWLQALREPTIVLRWQIAEWERVVRVSRRLRLLARLSESIETAGLLESVPAVVRRHLIAERRLSLWRTSAMLWAVERIATTLGGQPYPLVLLKGAAYVGQGLSISSGRLPSDLDIMVPIKHLAQAQAGLLQAGWRELELDEHDRHYYHQWSHEVPPMRHPMHRIELDLHHNIVPPVSRVRVDAELLLARLQPSIWPAWHVLHPVDQVLHCSAHLFLDSEMRDRLRDLVDLDGLMRHFGSQPDFWPELTVRAQALGLTEALAMACHFCTQWLGTPIPEDTLKSIVSIGPGSIRRSWLLPLLAAVLMPTKPDDDPSFAQDAAATILLARYHSRRMPLRLLVPHLWHKLRVNRRHGSDGVHGAA